MQLHNSCKLQTCNNMILTYVRQIKNIQNITVVSCKLALTSRFESKFHENCNQATTINQHFVASLQLATKYKLDRTICNFT